MSPRIAWLGTVLLVLLLCGSAAIAAVQPKRVLLINSYGHDFEPFSYFVTKFRSELSRQWGTPIDLYEVPVATARFAEGEREGPFVAYLESLFAGRHLDLVVAAGAPAARFIQRHRQQVFPTTPMAPACRDLGGAS